MVTTQSFWLSIALQANSQEYLLLFLFLVVALIFFALFFYWWRGVSDEDLDEVKEFDENQTTGPAITGKQMPQYAQAEADAEADLDNLLAEEAQFAAAAAVEEVEEETAVPEKENETVEEAEPVAVESDDLKKIEGIGPKIEELLNNAGIQTYGQLADSDVDQLKQILTNAGTRYKLADPISWPGQAKLAVAGDWDSLDALQDQLSAERHEE